MRWAQNRPRCGPAITGAGVQPPLRVTEYGPAFSIRSLNTGSSPSRKLRSYSARAWDLPLFALPVDGILLVPALQRHRENGFVPPWKGKGSPGRISGSLWFRLHELRALASVIFRTALNRARPVGKGRIAVIKKSRPRTNRFMLLTSV